MRKSAYWENFVQENKDSWHFDPGKKTQDYTYVGRLKTNFQPLLDLMDDDKIENFCIEKDIPCFRGPLEDVAKRMLDAAQYYKKDAFVRINGDSPLIDPCIISNAIKIYQNKNYDLVTNVFPRSFPIGQSVEVIRTSTFNKMYNL